MAESPLQWVVLASQFPATLDTDTNPTELQDGTTPDAYGLALDNDGLLFPAAIPTGTSKITKTYTIGTDIWTWYFRRLWRMTGTELQFNSPEYTAIYLIQGRGSMSFNEDSNALTTFFPFLDNMFVAKSTGGYVIPNANSHIGRFERLNIMENMGATNANNAIEMDGKVYASNAGGVYVFDGQKTTELTAKVQAVIASFASQTLTIQQSRRRIVCGTTGVIDSAGNLFRYIGTTFRFTTRALTSGDMKPFPVKAVSFMVDNPNQVDGTIVFQVRNDNDWVDPVTLDIKGQSGQVYWQEKPLDNLPQSRQFQLRIENMDAGIRVRSIGVLAKVVAAEESYPK